jgi:TetR/AcrR family transcriptional regulator, regulator of autoinduction and epiphytic fitness
VTPVNFGRGHIFVGRIQVGESLSRRERKKLETRQALLAAALDLFRAKGYDAATVEEITEQADVAKGTFFNYFASKEAMLGELALWSVEQLRATLHVDQGAPASPVARIKLLVRLMHEETRRDLDLIHRAFVVRLSTPLSEPDESKRQLFGLFRELVAEAQACGELRADVPADLLSDLLRFSFFHHMRALHGGCLAADDDPDQVVDLLMEGLAGPHWQPEAGRAG